MRLGDGFPDSMRVELVTLNLDRSSLGIEGDSSLEDLGTTTTRHPRFLCNFRHVANAPRRFPNVLSRSYVLAHQAGQNLNDIRGDAVACKNLRNVWAHS